MIVEIDSYFLEYVRQHDLFDKMMKNLISQNPMRNEIMVEDFNFCRFSWVRSFEGSSYWNNIHETFESRHPRYRFTPSRCIKINYQ